MERDREPGEVWEGRIPGREPSGCQSPEVGMTLASSRDTKEAAGERAREEERVWEERIPGLGRVRSWKALSVVEGVWVLL